MHKLLRRIATLVVVAPLPLMLAGTAHADDGPVIRLQQPIIYIQSVHSLVASGNYTGAVVNGVATVAFECHAAAGAAVSVAVTGCWLTSGPSAPSIALPGSVAATSAEAKIAVAPFQLCWSAVATYVDTTTNSTRGCTILQSTEAVPSFSGAGLSETT